MTSNVDLYWDQYLRSLPQGTAQPDGYADSYYFGIVPEDAPEISKLVLDGTKTASGGIKWVYEAEGTPMPKPGDLCVVTNGHDDPFCIVETVEVQVIPYDEVGEDFAYEGGEGDRSMADWRRIYWKYIVFECAKAGREPDVKTLLVMERFRVAYSQPLAKR